MLSHRLILPLLVAALACRAAGGAEFSAQDLEFFETDVRPLLVEHCYECHSGKSKKLQGGLRVDSRKLLLAGGDTGPAVVPGNLKDSLLIDAVRYGELYQMPPKSKLSAADINTLEQWVRRGAPWPDEDVSGTTREQFDLQSRKAEHWAWSAIQPHSPPPVRQADWPRDPLDHFILARLEDRNLRPAADAAPETLIRRLYFDLIGLPPRPEQVRAFTANPTPAAYEQIVEELLKSPQFGERWGRHWLDLMRYAESRGHEFDYDVPNAWQYRDYVIRALNADLPYDQFVREHLAGDLLPQPRRNPELGFNESVLGTGFWFLGEWVHSPVDIRKDETDRIDNAIDVFSKSMMALTVSCARCHDHKFDAISQKDYYALAGFLQSSAYRQVRFQTLDHNRQLVAQLRQLRQRASQGLGAALSMSLDKVALEKLLTTAVSALEQGVRLQSDRQPEIVVADFESGTYDGWQVEGTAFGDRPQTLETIASYQGRINAVGKHFVNSHNIRDSAAAAKGDPPTGKLTSPEFKVQRPVIQFLVGGGSHAGRTCVQLLIDGKVVRTAAGKNNNQMSLHRWDVAEFIGKPARFQAVDDYQGGWGNIGFDHIVQTEREGAGRRAAKPTSEELKKLLRLSQQHEVSLEGLLFWTSALLEAADDAGHPLHSLALAGMGRWSEAEAAIGKPTQNRSPAIPPDGQVIADFDDPDTPWLVDGPAFGAGPLPSGTMLLSLEPQIQEIVTRGRAEVVAPLAKLKLGPQTARDGGALGKWDRAGKTLRTKTFEIQHGRVFYLIRGAAHVQAVVDSHRMINGPLHGSLVRSTDTKQQWQWVEHNLSAYKGHRAHLEFSPQRDQLAIAMVVESPQPPKFASQPADNALAGCKSTAELVQGVQRLLQSAIRGAAKDPASLTSQQLDAAAWWGKQTMLWSTPARRALEAAHADYDPSRAELLPELQLESQTAPAIWDGDAEDEFLLVRGNPRTPGAPVPRRLLSAMNAEPTAVAGSGRLELAEQLLSPSNPFPSRVMANRIWHHLFGRGIVATVDNFGVLGEPPSHPQLLDHLADRFRQEGWSVKRLIRTIVLSRTYQMSAQAGPAAAEADPNNRLLQHMPLRRLEGEAIRDQMLSLSGRLDPQMFGPSIPVYLTEFMQGRGRPRSGPLDGKGRRSIYISVRRNFLSPMMLAFDTPQPFSCVGRRTTSNVPAQALILLNDPFVSGQAKGWAERLIAAEAEPQLRIKRMYLEALARQPSPEELAAAVAFVQQQAAARGVDSDRLPTELGIWADLCHVLFNVKEFIYLH